MKRIQTLISLLLLVVFMSGCIFGEDNKTSNSSPNSLIGTWEDWVSHGGGYRDRDTLTFNKDSTFNFGQDIYEPSGYVETIKVYGTYTVSGSIVTLTYQELGEEYVDKYTFSISGKTLILKNVYEGTELQYTKV